MSSRTFTVRETKAIVAQAVETALAALAQRPTATALRNTRPKAQPQRFDVQVIRITSGKQYNATLEITGTRTGPRGGHYVKASLHNGKATRKIEISGGQFERFAAGQQDEMIVPIDGHMWTITTR